MYFKIERKKSANININIGDTINNAQLMMLFQCSGQGGMRRSKKTKTLVLVKDRKSIYDDTWKNEVCYYTGMGQIGDQSFCERQNKTLYNLPFIDVEAYLFECRNSLYTFCGKVVLADEPYYGRQKDVNNKDRKVCMFPLRVKKTDSDIGYIPKAPKGE